MLIEDRPTMVVAGEAANCAEALDITARKQPDIILLDLDLGKESGLDFMRELLDTSPKAKIIILTGVHDPDTYRRAITLGATGLVFKEQTAEVLIKAIEKVHAGEAWLDRSLTATVLSEMSRPREAKKDDLEAAKIATLTNREREIITLVAQGLGRKEIADRLYISEATVRNHLTSIFGKLDLSDRFELVFYAYRHGLAAPPD